MHPNAFHSEFWLFFYKRASTKLLRFTGTVTVNASAFSIKTVTYPRAVCRAIIIARPLSWAHRRKTITSRRYTNRLHLWLNALYGVGSQELTEPDFSQVFERKIFRMFDGFLYKPDFSDQCLSQKVFSLLKWETLLNVRHAVHGGGKATTTTTTMKTT